MTLSEAVQAADVAEFAHGSVGVTVVADYGAFEAYASAYFFGESGYGYFDACSDVDVHVSQWFVCGAAFGGEVFV